MMNDEIERKQICDSEPNNMYSVAMTDLKEGSATLTA